ncbi:MAG TPA: hypothetical protein VFT37_04365 [Telluria sp.]|nr:hypothetical protein [Telluria sp.]
MNQVIVNDASEESIKQTARMLYLGHAVTFIFSLGLLNLIPLIINYIKRPYAQGTIVYSHHEWMVKSFWVYVALMAVAVVLMVTIILIPLAWLVGCAAWIWYAYRLIKGFIDLNNNRAMY